MTMPRLFISVSTTCMRRIPPTSSHPASPKDWESLSGDPLAIPLTSDSRHGGRVGMLPSLKSWIARDANKAIELKSKDTRSGIMIGLRERVG